ncbi:hypothetical protein SAMN04488003_103145 [Loktanella fryxellensis]|uniref:Uncharacterized protein n=1 Tax=Loktanella fryxellensis TaxID=245187 RepID=A0A1H8AFV7_9RHOB|nr:hypothetical protein [Loktanella fryxellensis]SEM69366.1 hypothetical protein SAMN04488003_103145 [Loktanella fryxellensis]
MTQTLTIPATDHGLIRLFKVTPPAPAELEERTPAALTALFGTDALDATYVDVVDTTQLAGLTLLDYLHQGYDIPAQDAADPAIRNLRGLVVIVMSRAARGQAVTLTLAPGVTHVTTTGDPARLRAPAAPLASKAAEGRLTGSGKPAPSSAAMSGRVATVALLVLFALVALMIWVAS